MSEAIQDAVIEEPKSPLANPEGKTVEELMEIARVLQIQVNDATARESQYETLRNRESVTKTKAQGGLEVILQLIPRDKVEELIKAEKEAAKETESDDS